VFGLGASRTVGMTVIMTLQTPPMLRQLNWRNRKHIVFSCSKIDCPPAGWSAVRICASPIF
jgi:hypothetical protein